MNPVPYVTIAVRALGFVLILVTLDSLGRLVSLILHLFTSLGGVSILAHLLDESYKGTPEFMRLATLALGLYLFLSGRWVIARLTRGLAWPGGGTCHKCGYDITGVDSARCPECGTKLPARKA